MGQAFVAFGREAGEEAVNGILNRVQAQIQTVGRASVLRRPPHLLHRVGGVAAVSRQVTDPEARSPLVYKMEQREYLDSIRAVANQ